MTHIKARLFFNLFLYKSWKVFDLPGVLRRVRDYRSGFQVNQAEADSFGHKEMMLDKFLSGAKKSSEQLTANVPLHFRGAFARNHYERRRVGVR